MTRYILFDFDGTLADSKAVTITAINKLAEKHRFPKIGPENLPALMRLSIRERCQLMGVSLLKLPFLVLELYPLYYEGLQEVKLFQGIKETLISLKAQGYSLAILSSNSEANIKAILKQQELDFMDQIICGRNVFGKDRVIRKFLKAQNLVPQQVMYVGDELRDVVACRKCKVPVTWVSWGFDLAETLQHEKPDHTAHTPADLLKIMREKASGPLMWKS